VRETETPARRLGSQVSRRKGTARMAKRGRCYDRRLSRCHGVVNDQCIKGEESDSQIRLRNFWWSDESYEVPIDELSIKGAIVDLASLSKSKVRNYQVY